MADLPIAVGTLAFFIAFLFLMGYGIQAAVDAHRASNQNGGDIAASVFSLLASIIALAAGVWLVVQRRR